MSELFKACDLAKLREGLTYPVTVDDEDLVLIRQGDEVFAMEDRCSHQDIPLSQGEVMEGAKLRCRAHGAQFCMKTGKALCAPAFAPVPVYPVVVKDGEVWIDLG